jgi:integrase/recombinase XerD
MPEHHITTVMETIDPNVTAGLSDADVIELWLYRQPSPLTRSAYERDIRRLRSWTGKTLSETTVLDLERFAVALSESGLASISVGRTLAAVRSLFRFAARVGYCANVAAGTDLPRNDSPLSARILSAEDIRRMIQLEPNLRNRVLMLLLYGTGLRVSEACGLCMRDIQMHLDSAQLTVTGKGRRIRTISLPPEVGDELLKLCNGTGSEEPVFSSRSGKPLDRSGVLRFVKAAAARAGVNPRTTTHWLRHAHASHALDRGAPIHLVQATLGHASVATTSRYLHARPGASSSDYISVF